MRTLILDTCFQPMRPDLILGGSEKVTFTAAKALGADILALPTDFVPPWGGKIIHTASKPLDQVDGQHAKNNRLKLEELLDVAPSYDLIINQAVSSSSLTVALAAMRLKRLPLINWVHVMFSTGRGDFSKMQKLMEMSKLGAVNLTVSPRAEREASSIAARKSSMLGFSETPLHGHVFPYVFEQGPSAPDGPKDYCVIVSRLAAEKNVVAGIKRFREIRKAGSSFVGKLVIYGATQAKEPEVEERIIKEIGSDPDITLLKDRPHSESWAAMAGAAFVISPCPRESFGLVPLEAAACNVPTLYVVNRDRDNGLVGVWDESLYVIPSDEKLDSYGAFDAVAALGRMSNMDLRGRLRERFSEESFRSQVQRAARFR